MTISRRFRPAEAGARIGISSVSVIALIRSGAIPALNVGVHPDRPRYLINESDLERFEESRAVKAGNVA